jgi:hypothetical protein
VPVSDEVPLPGSTVRIPKGCFVHKEMRDGAFFPWLVEQPLLVEVIRVGPPPSRSPARASSSWSLRAWVVHWMNQQGESFLVHLSDVELVGPLELLAETGSAHGRR